MSADATRQPGLGASREAAQAAARKRWKLEADPAAATLKARRARWERYLALVDPDETLALEERERRAELLRHADMMKMAAASAAARRKRSKS